MLVKGLDKFCYDFDTMNYDVREHLSWDSKTGKQ
jgi:hypothetical protein